MFSYYPPCDPARGRRLHFWLHAAKLHPAAVSQEQQQLGVTVQADVAVISKDPGELNVDNEHVILAELAVPAAATSMDARLVKWDMGSCGASNRFADAVKQCNLRQCLHHSDCSISDASSGS